MSNPIRNISLFLAFITASVLTVAFNHCSNARFTQIEAASKSDIEDLVEGINEGKEIDEEALDECTLVNPDFPLACVVFKDSFERDRIVDHEDFHWETVLMDNSDNTSNVDVEIAHQDYLGGAAKEENAILFRGREGKSSDHEVFLVSAPFDLKAYTYVVVQYKYMPIGLEDFIKLTASGIETVEGPRVDFCVGTDYDCGLTSDSGRHRRLRDPDNWSSYFPEYVSGQDNNIRAFAKDGWIMHQVLVPVADLPEDRRSKIVFKISVALDEGFYGNDRDRLMEDGVIIDDVVFAAIRVEGEN